jgi:hypothetical protein
MADFEYRVLPAPAKGRKAPGVKGAAERFAHTIEEAINRMAREGWEYLRSDILPSEERQGLTSTHTVYRSVLVFRRARAAPAPDADGTAAQAPPEPAAEGAAPAADAETPERGEVETPYDPHSYAATLTPEEAEEGTGTAESPDGTDRQK